LSLIKQKHQTLFEQLTTTLLEDLGGVVVIRLGATSTDCLWCEYDTYTGQSSGRPSSGYDWTTHDDYTNSLRCPNCGNAGVIKTYTTVTLSKTHIEDISGIKYVGGKAGYFPAGTKRIIGLISEVEVGGINYLETANKITIGTEDYSLLPGNYERLGIKDDHLFRAIVERTEFLEK